MDELSKLKAIYFPSECDIDEDLFLPIAQRTSIFDCMVGYFTSGSLEELARSLVAYLSSSPDAKLKLIASPCLSEEDATAIKQAVNTKADLVPMLFPDFQIDERSLTSNTVKALCYLISAGKMELKIAIRDQGMFHTKCWLFETSLGSVAIHGSGNSTRSGLVRNFEQLAVARTWLSDESQEVFEDLRNRFDKIWSNDYEGIICAALNSATIEHIQKINQENSEKNQLDQWTISKELKDLLLAQLEGNEDIDSEPVVQQLKIPIWLKYEEGEYAHQGLAVNAWLENDSRGILSIATGGGKTLTSLVAASLLGQTVEKIFVVITVPTTTLLSQWDSDVRSFSVEPITTLDGTASAVKRKLKEAVRKLRLGLSKAEVLLITHDSLKGSYSSQIESLSDGIPTLLIGDEVHNLGAVGFKSAPPEYFDFRLGLSATYERAFDEEGNEFLLNYFGKVVFDYPLDEAIGNCLVPYEYYAHEVSLTAEEEEEFLELTYQIKKISYASNFSDDDSTKERLKRLLLKRRRIVESASLKVGVLSKILPSEKADIHRALIFCTAKYPNQLEEVNTLLNSRGLEFHQLTQEETSNQKTLKGLVKAFSDGDLQVLTSKRVLDEGFNVPQTEVAYLIASETGKRQWIQRLGRILRLSPSTNKEKAILHDFVVIPSIQKDLVDDDFISILRSEYERVSFFSKLSLNGLEEDGSVFLANKLLDLMRNR